MAVFVGLDCGGSSTRVLAIDENGKPLFRGQSGPANLLSTPKALILKNLQAATRKCPPPVSVCGCFAGLVDDAVRKQANQLLKQVFPSVKKIRSEADYVAALAACGAETDVCVIAGTGSIVCSWRDGTAVKTGGRGPLLGDPGSAAQIGKRALNEYLNDHSIASKHFLGELSELFGSTAEKEIIVKLYGSSSPAASLGKLSEAVAAESAHGAKFAKEIIQSEMAALASLVSSHLQEHSVKKESLRVGLAGGLWKSGQVFKTVFQEVLEKKHPKMKIELFILKRPPVEGAAQLAKEISVVN